MLLRDDAAVFNGQSSLSAEDSALPEPTYPPPCGNDFIALPLRQQLAYTRTILLRIIRHQYPPAKWRHEAFIRGGATRVNLQKRSRTGPLDTNEVESIGAEVRLWALRDEMWAEKMVLEPELGSEADAEGEVDLDPEADAHLRTDLGTGERSAGEAELAMTITEPEATVEVDIPGGPQDRDEDDTMDTSVPMSRPVGCSDYENLSRVERSQVCPTPYLAVYSN